MIRTYDAFALHGMTAEQMWQMEWMRDGQHLFPLPRGCEACRGFDRALLTEPVTSVFITNRTQLVAQFRMTHHHPVFAFVDRSAEYLKRAGTTWGPSLLWDLARFIVMAEQG